MIDVKVDLRGLDTVLRNEPGRVDAWLRGVATQMVGEIKLSFGTGAAGRSYKRGAKWHVASAAGSPPNTDTGALINSIRMAPSGNLEYKISDGVEYGVHLEFGTSRMGARPFMGPVFNDWGAKIEDDAKRNLTLE